MVARLAPISAIRIKYFNVRLSVCRRDESPPNVERQMDVCPEDDNAACRHLIYVLVGGMPFESGDPPSFYSK
jgi:hypothetical protein